MRRRWHLVCTDNLDDVWTTCFKNIEILAALDCYGSATGVKLPCCVSLQAQPISG